MTKPHFHGWGSIEKGYYTKTKLRNELGLKPISEEEYDATLKAMTPRGWKDFVLYHIDNAIEIKQRKITEVEITPSNLAEAMYIINKSAKKSRDTKSENYYMGNYGVVSRAKTRQSKLYDLKNEVISKLINENAVIVKGYHKQKSYNDAYNFLMLLEFCGYTFHQPISMAEAEGLEELGEIDIIPSERTRKVKLKFFESVNLLERYVLQGKVVKESRIVYHAVLQESSDITHYDRGSGYADIFMNRLRYV